MLKFICLRQINNQNQTKMKNLKIVLLSVLTLGLTLTSCSDDDKKDNNTSAALEGKWVYAKEGVGGNGQEILTDYEHTAGCNKDYMEITSTTVKDVWYDKNGTECEEGSDTVAYTRNGNTITVTEGGETYTSTIEKLTSTELRITDTETMEGQTVKYISTYTRM